MTTPNPWTPEEIEKFLSSDGVQAAQEWDDMDEQHRRELERDERLFGWLFAVMLFIGTAVCLSAFGVGIWAVIKLVTHFTN